MDKLLALLKKLGAEAAEIEAVKAEIEADKEADIAGLKAKNTELLGKLAKKTTADDGGKVAELEAKLDELTEASDKLKRESDKSIKALTAERDQLQASLGETSSKAREYQTGVTLREALAKVGVGKINPEDVTDAISFVKSILKYNDQGEALVTYKDANGKDVEQALGEYVEKVYPTTSHAKRFIPAGGNRGAGGNHKLGQGGASAGNPWVKDTFNLTRQIELLNTNKPEAQRLAAEAGVTIT